MEKWLHFVVGNSPHRFSPTERRQKNTLASDSFDDPMPPTPPLPSTPCRLASEHAEEIHGCSARKRTFGSDYSGVLHACLDLPKAGDGTSLSARWSVVVGSVATRSACHFGAATQHCN